MKCLLAAIFVGLIAIGSAFGQNPLPPQANAGAPIGDVAKDLASYFDQLVAEDKLSGAVLVARDGVPIASKAAGVANKTNGSPIKLDTKFNLGSLNKMFTAVAIAQLAQKGRLTFDDTISKHLPDYSNKEVAGKVTIHQ